MANTTNLICPMEDIKGKETPADRKDLRKRMQLVLNADTAAKLESLSQSRQISSSQVVRQAIQTEDFLQKELKEGSKIIIHRKDGTFREILLRN